MLEDRTDKTKYNKKLYGKSPDSHKQEQTNTTIFNSNKNIQITTHEEVLGILQSPNNPLKKVQCWND